MGKQRLNKPVTDKKKYAVLRDGNLCGIGLSKEDAHAYANACGECYPDTPYEVIPSPKKGTDEKE